MADKHSPLRDEEIEAEARVILREMIERTGWYPALRKAEREKLIERDIEYHWHLVRAKAVRRLEQRRERDP